MGKRNVTHTITNHTVFSSAELLKKLPEMIDPGNPPPDSLLPTFLHEATHHWCFTSTVGTTIAILAMRGRVNALRAVEADTPQEAKVWEERASSDITRAEVASLLLRPLAEGLATFAEFDLSASQHSPVVPPPLRWAMMFTARDQLTGSSTTRVRRRMNIAQSSDAALIEARRSEQVRRTKQALLLEPLSCQAGDGYLAGYLVIKALWRYLQSHHDRFHEPEVFLLKAYDLFYEDTEFARLLLDQSQSIPAALSSLAQQLLKRLNYAFGDSKNSLDDFFDSLVSAQSRLYADDNVDGLVLPLADLIEGDPRARFLSIWETMMAGPIANLPGNSADWSRWQSATFAMHAIAYSRDLLELGSLPVTLEATESETVVQVEGQAVARLPTVNGALLGRTGGTIHIFLSTRSGEHIVVAASPQLHLVALQKTPELDKSDDVPTTRSVMGRIVAARAADSIMREAADDLSRLRELSRLGGYLQQTQEHLDALYSPFALIYVPKSKLNDLLTKMMTDGVYGAFDYDADLVRALAIIGSMAHLYWTPEHLKSEFDKQGLDYESLMEKLWEYSRSTNLFILKRVGPLLQCDL